MGDDSDDSVAGDPSKPEKNDKEFENIVKHRIAAFGKIEVLLKWVGWPHSDNTWQDKSTVEELDIWKDYKALHFKKKIKTENDSTPVAKKRKTTEDTPDPVNSPDDNLSDKSPENISENLEEKLKIQSKNAADEQIGKTYATKPSEIIRGQVQHINRDNESEDERRARILSQCDLSKYEELIIKKFGKDFKEKGWQIARSIACLDRYNEGFLEVDD